MLRLIYVKALDRFLTTIKRKIIGEVKFSVAVKIRAGFDLSGK